jgi:hypothetical protein
MGIDEIKECILNGVEVNVKGELWPVVPIHLSGMDMVTIRHHKRCVTIKQAGSKKGHRILFDVTNPKHGEEYQVSLSYVEHVGPVKVIKVDLEGNGS